MVERFSRLVAAFDAWFTGTPIRWGIFIGAFLGAVLICEIETTTNLAVLLIGALLGGIIFLASATLLGLLICFLLALFGNERTVSLITSFSDPDAN